MILGGRRILVVEDLFYLAMEVRAALVGAGAEVAGPFSTAKAAAESLQQRLPDGAVLDVNLGEETSYDLARSLRQRQVPFLFFTGYHQDALLPEFADVARLEKPLEPGRLVRSLANLFAARQAGNGSEAEH